MSRKTNMLRRLVDIARAHGESQKRRADRLAKDNTKLLSDLVAANAKLAEPFQCFKTFINKLPNFRRPEGMYQVTMTVAMREFLFAHGMQRGPDVGSLIRLVGDQIRDDVINAIMTEIRKDGGLHRMY